jgi:hypothetical protein
VCKRMIIDDYNSSPGVVCDSVNVTVLVRPLSTRVYQHCCVQAHYISFCVEHLCGRTKIY